MVERLVSLRGNVSSVKHVACMHYNQESPGPSSHSRNPFAVISQKLGIATMVKQVIYFPELTYLGLHGLCLPLLHSRFLTRAGFRISRLAESSSRWFVESMVSIKRDGALKTFRRGEKTCEPLSPANSKRRECTTSSDEKRSGGRSQLKTIVLHANSRARHFEPRRRRLLQKEEQKSEE